MFCYYWEEKRQVKSLGTASVLISSTNNVIELKGTKARRKSTKNKLCVTFWPLAKIKYER